MSIHVDLSQVIHTLKCSVSNNIPINFCVLFYKRKIAFTIRYTPFNLKLDWQRFFRGGYSYPQNLKSSQVISSQHVHLLDVRSCQRTKSTQSKIVGLAELPLEHSTNERMLLVADKQLRVCCLQEDAACKKMRKCKNSSEITMQYNLISVYSNRIRHHIIHYALGLPYITNIFNKSQHMVHNLLQLHITKLLIATCTRQTMQIHL